MSNPYLEKIAKMSKEEIRHGGVSALGHTISGAALYHNFSNVGKSLKGQRVSGKSVALGLGSTVAGSVLDHVGYKGQTKARDIQMSKALAKQKTLLSKSASLSNQVLNTTEETIEKEAGLVDGAMKLVGKLGASAASATSKVVASPIVGKAVNMAIKNPMRTAVGAGALASGAGALMARSSREKQACVERLMTQGINFEEAVELTKQASKELYGE